MALRRCARRGIVAALGADSVCAGLLKNKLRNPRSFVSDLQQNRFDRVVSEIGFFRKYSDLQRNCGFDRGFAGSVVKKNVSEAGLSRKSSVLQQNRGLGKPLLGLQQNRGFATETLTEKWRQTTERMKQAVMEKPRALAQSVKQSEFAEGTMGAMSTLSAPVKKSLVSYREALKLQLEAFWRRNYLVVVGAVGLAACLLLWRIMFGIASLFVSLSEGMAKYGFLALAAAVVSFSGMFMKAKYTINPDAVYRIAMRKLNTSAEVLKALGAPLSGTDIRAYVMTGGSEKRGLVSIETKKKQGQYDFKLLAVDVAGQEGRIYVVGDDAEYKIGGGLIAELRDPIVKAMAAQNEFEAQDDKEEREEEEQHNNKQSIL